MNSKVLKEYLYPLVLVGAYIAIILFKYGIMPSPALEYINNENLFNATKNGCVDILLMIPFIAYYCRNHRVHNKEAKSAKRTYIWLFVVAIIVGIGTSVFYNFSIKKLYAAIYYLFIVSCGEEFVFRGYLFSALKRNSSFMKSSIISGIMFGLSHGLFQFMILNQSWINIPSSLGGGIVGSLFFAMLLEKSGTIVVPIFVHWILDYIGFLI